MRRIYVDLDDVLAQTGRMFLRLLAQQFDRIVAFEQLRSYHLGESLGLEPDELAEFLNLAHEPGALASIEPMPGATETLTDWRARGYEVFVVTGRPPSTLESSLDWLSCHDVPYTGFHFLDKYSQIYGAGQASPDGTLSLVDLPELDFCLAVEDFPGIAVHLARELRVPVALFDRPWNREVAAVDDAERAPIVRCCSWSEIQQRFPEPQRRPW